MKKTFYINGMHCASCEILLEKELYKIKGVGVLGVSHKTHSMELEVEENASFEAIEASVKKCGFELAENKEAVAKGGALKRNSLVDYLEMLAITIVVLDLIIYFSNVDITRFFPNISGQVSVFIALLFGLIASVSTCLVLVGGIVLSFGSIYPTEESKSHPIMARAAAHLYFHSGRILGFALLGGTLGLIGKSITYSFSFTGYLTLFVAVVMFYMGLYILNIVPSITKLGFHLPKFLTKNMHSLEKNDHHFTPIMLGVMTFFLPCGFTQSMQIASVASGSFITGALIMGAFALGTVPVLLSIGMGATYAKDYDLGLLKRVAGVLIVFFAIYSINSSVVLAGFSSPIDYVTSKMFPSIENNVSRSDISFTEGAENIALNDDAQPYQIVKMDVDWTFKPTKFVVKKGIPVRWEINGINITGCSNEVVIPRLNLSKKIEPGLNVLEFTPTKTGRLNFSCWMGMIGGSFIVVENDVDLKKLKDDSVVKNTEYNDPVFKGGSCGGSCGTSSCGAAKKGRSCGCSARSLME